MSFYILKRCEGSLTWSKSNDASPACVINRPQTKLSVEEGTFTGIKNLPCLIGPAIPELLRRVERGPASLILTEDLHDGMQGVGGGQKGTQAH